MSDQHAKNIGMASPPLNGFDPPTSHSVEDAEVVVIGGGIVGVSLSLFLAKMGISTALVEKGRIGGEQSGRNLGFCRASGRDDAETPLGLLSLELWDELSRTINDDLGFRRCGRLYLCETDAQLADQERAAGVARNHGIRVNRLSPSEIDDFLPDATRHWVGAFHTPGDGRAEPEFAAPAIARAAHKAGARVYTNCAARSLDVRGARVTGVVTEWGRIACSKVVITTGAWSSPFLRALGVRFPIMQIAASVMRTAPVSGNSDLCIGTGDFGFRRHLDGSFSISPFGGAVSLGPDTLRFAFDFLPALRERRRAISFRLDRRSARALLLELPWGQGSELRYEREREIECSASARRLAYAFEKFLEARPDCTEVPILHRWAGVIDASPDSVPTIDAVSGTGGLWVAGGFSGHGFGLGPGAARLLSELVTGAKPSVDVTPFRMNRKALSA